MASTEDAARRSGGEGGRGGDTGNVQTKRSPADQIARGREEGNQAEGGRKKTWEQVRGTTCHLAPLGRSTIGCDYAIVGVARRPGELFCGVTCGADADESLNTRKVSFLPLIQL